MIGYLLGGVRVRSSAELLLLDDDDGSDDYGWYWYWMVVGVGVKWKLCKTSVHLNCYGLPSEPIWRES